MARKVLKAIGIELLSTDFFGCLDINIAIAHFPGILEKSDLSNPYRPTKCFHLAMKKVLLRPRFETFCDVWEQCTVTSL